MALAVTEIDAERSDLLQSLGKQRHFLRYTTRGLTDEQARARTTVSALTLGGLVKHVTGVERGWASFIVEGPSATGNASDMTEADYARWQDQFRLLEGETLAGVLAEYETAAAATDELVRTLPDLGATPAAADRTLVRGQCAVVGSAGAAAHHRRDGAARRARRHHPRVDRRPEVDGLSGLGLSGAGSARRRHAAAPGGGAVSGGRRG